MRSDVLQVLNSIRKHYTRKEYFPKPILFTIIYLLQKEKLNHRNYSSQKINISNF
jgi:hypothetical protein